MADNTYNGWTNSVNLWLSNEEELYRDVRGLVKLAADDSDKDEAIAILEDDIREYVESLPEVAAVLEAGGLVADLLSLDQVDWRELAESWYAAEVEA